MEEKMRLGICIALGFLIIAQTVCADESLPLLKTGAEVYSNVTVLSATATDVYFTYNNGHGMANAKLKSLSPELQRHFHYNATNALALEKKQIAANTQYHENLVSHPAPPPPNEARPAPPTAAAPDSRVLWRMDLPGALSQAQSENKMVLLDFTGSDWCPWCIKFDQEVLSTGQFAAYANDKLVLVKLDFPRHTEQSAALKQANQELYQRFNVDGYPTYILLNSSGKELGRQVGYAKGGPTAFITELNNFSSR
jgi:thiol-disulfide isomerase/thioredoxin